MKTFFLGFVASLVLLPAFALAYFRLGLAATPSDAPPPGWEAFVMQSAVRASVRRSAAALQAPPVEHGDDAVIEGGRLYLNGGAGCHGTPGKPGEDLSSYPRVPQLPQAGTAYSQPETYWIIKHGIRNTAMSAYGRFYSDKQVWSLTAFLRQVNHLPPGMLERIQAKTTLGSP